MTPPQTAFIGAGIMGRPMARNLLAAGYPLAAWNRTRGKAAALAEYGATVADSPATAAAGAQFVFVMVSDSAAADAVLFAENGALENITPGACIIVSSTLPPQTARRQAETCRRRGVDYLDAPVSGGEKGATDGDLAIMVGGGKEVYARAEPLLRALGRPKRIGASGCGQLAKLANQAIVGATIAAVTEALLLARAGGADMAAVREALSGGFADSTVLQQHGRRMVEADFTPGGPAKYQLRDLQNAVSEAARGGVETPVTAAAAAMFEEMIGAADPDYAELDHSALFKFWQARAPA